MGTCSPERARNCLKGVAPGYPLAGAGAGAHQVVAQSSIDTSFLAGAYAGGTVKLI